MIRSTFAFYFDQDGEVSWLLAVPFGKRLEKLETVRGRCDLYLDGGAVRGRWLECVLTWVVAARWEFETRGRGEFEGGT